MAHLVDAPRNGFNHPATLRRLNEIVRKVANRDKQLSAVSLLVKLNNAYQW